MEGSEGSEGSERALCPAQRPVAGGRACRSRQESSPSGCRMFTSSSNVRRPSEKNSVDAVAVQAAHRAGMQPGGTYRENEVAGLQDRAEPAQFEPHRVVRGQVVLQLRMVRRDQLGVFVVVAVQGEHRGDRRALRLRPVTFMKVRTSRSKPSLHR